MQLVATLVERGLISAADKPRALEAIAAAPDRPPHTVLIDRGFLKEDTILPVLAELFGLEWVDLTQMKVESEALTAIPLKLIHRKNLMPLSRYNGSLVVATGDPYDAYALDELNTLTGLHVHPVLA
ncbi:MAG: type II/IV secretion system protein, partial [Gemmataceae bacterium]